MESQYSCIIYSLVVYVAKLTCPQLYVLNFHGNIVKKSSKPFSLVSLKKKKQKTANTVGDFHSFFFLVFSLILPAFYSGIAIHYELPRDGLAQKHEDFWFVKWPDSQFNVLLTMNLILVISYLILTAYLMKMLRSKALVRKNPHER